MKVSLERDTKTAFVKNARKCLKRSEVCTKLNTDELLGYWNQSNISELNIKRIDQLKNFPSAEIQELALFTSEVASVKPHKKRRMPWLKINHRDLFNRAMAYFGDDDEGIDGIDQDIDIFSEDYCES